MTNRATLFQAASPTYHQKSELYDPNNPDTSGKVVPRIGALIHDDVDGKGVLYTVVSVDPDTYEYELSPTKQIISNEDTSPVSFVDYRNNIFYIYVDRRTYPTRLFIDTRLQFGGSNNAFYRLRKDLEQQTIISQYYNGNGVNSGVLIPMTQIGADNIWSCTNCHTGSVIEDGEIIILEVFDTQLAMVAQVSCIIRTATILNEISILTSPIVDIKLKATQELSPEKFFIYEKQPIESLNITATLIYEDGHERDVLIDYTKCYIYGIEDFVAAYAGLEQTVMVKYYLEQDEVVGAQFEPVGHISKEATITVIQNELSSPMKISVIPNWNKVSNKYQLQFYIYNTDRDKVIDVTPHVSFRGTQFNGILYGVEQTLVLSVDLMQIMPIAYTTPTTYEQPLAIRLQPQAALERYSIKTSSSDLKIYGVDSPTSRRPILRYDETLRQYYIPSSIFTTKASFINSFYTNANPMYLVGIENGPVTPTHFTMRDIFTGAMVTTIPIPVEDYSAAFNITGEEKDRYSGKTVIIEFQKVVGGDQTLILYGVPVDVYSGNYIA